MRYSQRLALVVLSAVMFVAHIDATPLPRELEDRNPTLRLAFSRIRNDMTDEELFALMAPFLELYAGHYQWRGWTDGKLVVYVTLSMDFSGTTPDRVRSASLYQNTQGGLRPLSGGALFILPYKRVSTVERRQRMKD